MCAPSRTNSSRPRRNCSFCNVAHARAAFSSLRAQYHATAFITSSRHNRMPVTLENPAIDSTPTGLSCLVGGHPGSVSAHLAASAGRVSAQLFSNPASADCTHRGSSARRERSAPGASVPAHPSKTAWISVNRWLSSICAERTNRIASSPRVVAHLRRTPRRAGIRASASDIRSAAEAARSATATGHCRPVFSRRMLRGPAGNRSASWAASARSHIDANSVRAASGANTSSIPANKTITDSQAPTWKAPAEYCRLTPKSRTLLGGTNSDYV